MPKIKVKAVRDFVARIDGHRRHFNIGDEFILPGGSDWLKAGLVVPVRGSSEKETVKHPERAVKNEITEKKRGINELPGNFKRSGR